jgi:hypothetical protein
MRMDIEEEEKKYYSVFGDYENKKRKWNVR